MTGAYLYLLRMTGTDLFKIGIATRPCKRLEQIAGASGAVEIVRVWPGLAHYERSLHRRYSAQRVRDCEQVPDSGRTEWFRLQSSDVEAIKTACYLESLQAQERGRLKQRARCL